MRSNKGITLIALIITIIVMLILVAVSVNILVDSDLIGAAEKTSDAYKSAYEEEKYLDVKTSDGKTIKDIEEELGLDIKQIADTTPGQLAGEGTEANPYLIESIEDLVAFSDEVNAGNTFEGKYVELKQTLDFKSTLSYEDAKRTTLTTKSTAGEDITTHTYENTILTHLSEEEGFTPIGSGQVANEETEDVYCFAGTFEGNTKRIVNLYINGVDTGDSYIYLGLFGYNTGTIQNLKVVANIKDEFQNYCEEVYIGGIAGINYGSIMRVSVSGNIDVDSHNGYTMLGGLTGLEHGALLECSSNINIYCENFYAGGEIDVGGLTGYANSASVKRCWFNGIVYTPMSAKRTFLYIRWSRRLLT